MAANDCDRQTAIQLAGDLWRQTLDYFFRERKRIPSWGEEVDRAVALYVQGLEDWIIANAEWSFETERYFGKDAQKIKQSLEVELLPLRQRD